MRIHWLVLLVFVLLSLFSDCYIYACLKSRFKSSIPGKIQVWSAVICYLMLICSILSLSIFNNGTALTVVMWMLYAFLSVYISKIVFTILDLVASAPKLLKYRRIRILSIVATTLSVAVFATMWWGAFVERFRLDVKEVELLYTDLPQSFDGYKIIQISDLHTGTYGNDTNFMSKLVDTVNKQQPDLIVFTGDIVNARAYEITPYVEVLSGLSATDGVYSIMGNHDYGDYARWSSFKEKEKSIEYLQSAQADMGWHMLNNDKRFICRDSDCIALIGVENIGDPPFPTYGSLTKAYPNLSDSVFKVLLSHNPAHWVDSISNREDINIPLTLSGHTHAMQIELFGWSPAVFRYRTWGGLYTAENDSSKRLYVNIGIGTVGLPARIGATPEITLITLRKKDK